LNQLSRAEASAERPVEFAAQVTLYRPRNFMMTVEAGGCGAYVAVSAKSPWRLEPGQWVRIEGRTSPGSFAPVIRPEQIVVLRPGTPHPHILERNGWHDVHRENTLVRARGRLVQITHDDMHDSSWGIRVQVGDGSVIPGVVFGAKDRPERWLPGTQLRFLAVLGSESNGKGQRANPWLFLQSPDWVEALDPPPLNWQLPVTPSSGIMTHRASIHQGDRVHLRGTVTLIKGKGDFIVQDAAGGIRVVSGHLAEVRVGQAVELVGTVRNDEVRGIHVAEAILRPHEALPALTAVTLTHELIEERMDYGDRLVTAEVEVLGMRPPEHQGRQLVVQSAGTDPYAVFLTRGVPVPEFEPGARLRVTGVAELTSFNHARPDSLIVHVNQLGSIQVLSRAPVARRWPWLNFVMGSLILCSLALAWAIGLRRAVKTRTRELAAAKETAEAASRAKGQFLAHMSHEMRTPLNGVLGLTQLTLATDLKPEQREYLELARASGTLLLQLINDVLDLARIEAGRVELRHEVFDPESLVRQVAQCLRPVAQEKGLMLLAGIAPGVPREVEGDPVRLRQILTNLLGNAVKFTESGWVEIRLELLEQNGPTARIRFAVEDTGVGIAAAEQQRIFLPFEQAAASARTGGTGLGLAISRRLADLMGGSLAVTSSAGRGSCFTLEVTLPCRAGAVAVAAGPCTLAILDPQEPRRRALSVVARHTAPSVCSATGWSGIPVCDVLLVAADIFDPAAFEEWRRSSPSARSWLVLTGEPTATQRQYVERYGLGVLTHPVLPSDLRSAFEPTADDTPSKLLRALDGLHVLLAEDNRVNQLVIRKMMESAGARVEVTDNGTDALDRALQVDFDLIVLDIQMPGLNGLEVARALRAQERGTAVSRPMVALTAQAFREQQIEALMAGFDEVLAKPVERDALIDSLVRHVQVRV
jgi:signal transduction histidine kinase/CheY-like chemotaxis protein